MTFNGADGLGNALDDDVKIKIKVVEPDPFEIKLTPGWNLVSLPAEPQMSGINDVVGADHPASIVLTYDPTQPGAWLSSSRGDDGVFAGSLESIGARTAYWIFTDGFDSIKVPITRPTGGGVTLLPTVNLVAGWNLLPVLDVGGAAALRRRRIERGRLRGERCSDLRVRLFKRPLRPTLRCAPDR